MAKITVAVCLLLCITCAVKAQETSYTRVAINPFTGLDFNNSYKDTITLSAVYTGEHGSPGDKNILTLQQIQKLYGTSIRKFKNAIGFSFKGYPGNFYAPYSTNNEQVVTAIKPKSLIHLKCTVYKFFTVDGISNFFCVDKIL